MYLLEGSFGSENTAVLGLFLLFGGAIVIGIALLVIIIGSIMKSNNKESTFNVNLWLKVLLGGVGAMIAGGVACGIALS
ncbi:MULTISPECIES: hypothetical protein [Sphingobacterium]|uniref:Uncharacterized protein n=2 Tax=Sphingobacterium TaxID=28453 RepID=A0A420ARC2_SPHD1|nr:MULTISPECIES: hypothetical protein [Sphingobacterium]MCS4225605.1 hypothetical protein [Sphingobacterium sp. BIGb0165]RKE47021.1 hypothetical protein DFQ12_4180 [Sphingobacterium detergens]ULT26106.1 hypothetical protein KUH03_03915 [Sphingobacterium sp. E70]